LLLRRFPASWRQHPEDDKPHDDVHERQSDLEQFSKHGLSPPVDLAIIPNVEVVFTIRMSSIG
jgi:hypothetical protein